MPTTCGIYLGTVYTICCGFVKRVTLHIVVYVQKRPQYIVLISQRISTFCTRQTDTQSIKQALLGLILTLKRSNNILIGSALDD